MAVVSESRSVTISLAPYDFGLVLFNPILINSESFLFREKLFLPLSFLIFFNFVPLGGVRGLSHRLSHGWTHRISILRISILKASSTIIPRICVSFNIPR